MGIKLTGKEWKCNNQCQSNCCSAVWLKISPEQRASMNKNGYFITEPNYTDWRWLKFHKQVDVIKLDGGMRKIVLKKAVDKILFNPHAGSDFLFLVGDCDQLMKNNRCKVYRNRPMACKVAKCPVFEENKEKQWFAVNGNLKEEVEKYKGGELKKWD